MITIISASSPKYADASGNVIDVLLETAEYGVIPYTASSSDDPYGIFATAISGAYGPIAPYEPPTSGPLSPKVWAAAYMLDVVDGEVLGAENAARIWGVIYTDVGRYLIYFDAPPSAVSYFPYPYDDSVFMRAPRDGRGENWFTVEAKDAAGNFSDPESFSVEVKIIS